MSGPNTRIAAMVALSVLIALPGAFAQSAPALFYAWMGIVLVGIAAVIYSRATWFRARAAISRRDYPTAIHGFRRHLDELERGPGWNRLLGFTPYTNDARAATLNNIGVCEMAEKATVADAVATFQRAAALDPEYAMPHVNLGLLATAQRDPDAASRHFAQARRLGFNDRALQAMIRRVTARMGTAIGDAIPK